MPYATGSYSPLVFYPPVAQEGMPDFGFTLGVPGGAGAWQAVGGTPPTAVTGEGESLGKAVRCTGDLTHQSYIQTGLLLAPTLDPASTDPYYLYTRCKSKSGGSLSVNAVSVDFYRADNSYTGVRKGFSVSCLDDMKNDNRWRVFRSAPITGIPSDAAKLGGLGGETGFHAAAEFFIDWIYFGHAWDPAGFGPAGQGVMFVGPFDWKRSRPGVSERSTRRGVARRTIVDESSGGKFVSNLADDAAIVDWRRSRGILRAGDWKCTVFANRQDASRDYFPKAVIVGGDDGATNRGRHRAFEMGFRTA